MGRGAARWCWSTETQPPPAALLTAEKEEEIPGISPAPALPSPARSPTGKPIWEQLQGSAPWDTEQSRGRGEMDLRADKPVTSLRMGDQPITKTQGPEISFLSIPSAQIALSTSTGSLSQVGSSTYGKNSENREAGDPGSSPRSLNSFAVFLSGLRMWNVCSNLAIREGVVWV